MVAGVWDEKLYDYIPETDHIVFYPDGKPYPILRTTVLICMRNIHLIERTYQVKLCNKSFN